MKIYHTWPRTSHRGEIVTWQLDQSRWLLAENHYDTERIYVYILSFDPVSYHGLTNFRYARTYLQNWPSNSPGVRDLILIKNKDGMAFWYEFVASPLLYCSMEIL